MGDEPPKEGETLEVTVELEGEVSKEAFDEYRRQLRDCLEKLAALTDPTLGGRRLRVRRVRWALVRQPPRPRPWSGSGA